MQRMEKAQKAQVLEILDYWKTIEFLGQTDIPKVSHNNRTKKRYKKEIFIDLVSPYIDIEKLLETDLQKYQEYPSVGDEIDFCLGEIDRNAVVDCLENFLETKEENPEIVYPKTSKIAWCSSRGCELFLEYLQK